MFLPLILLATWANHMMRKRMGEMGGANAMMFGGGKSGAKQYVVEESEAIKFADVAGEDEAKESLQEIVDFLHNPKRYEEIGAKMPKGVLLVGPPGTGKTLLARAVAGEAGVPFFSIAGSEFVEMFVGMGASKVRDLFKQAGEKAPCIVFIDEIDTIGKKRDGAGAVGGNDEREQTLNQLLTEMDGFDAAKGVIILAATNRPESLDPALTRPGRFDRRVPVELPDLKGREAILRLHAQKVRLGPDCDFSVVARMTSGASGAELANIVNEAALGAVRRSGWPSPRPICRRRWTPSWPAPRRKTRSSATGNAASSPTTRWATRWWRPSSPTPPRCRKSRSCPAPPARWASRCRWSRATGC